MPETAVRQGTTPAIVGTSPEEAMPVHDTPAQVAHLTAQLGALPTGHPDQTFIRRYLGTPRQVLGVRAADLHKLARTTARAQASWPDAAWLALLDALYAGTLFEQRSLAGSLLGVLHPLRRRLDLARLRGWLAQQAGWAEVDSTCQSIWTDKEVLARWDEWDAFLDALSVAEKISLRRASLVLLIPPLRHNADPRLTQRALVTLQRLQGERSPMISKAVSWLLRAMIAEQPETVRRYLAENAALLPSTVLRQVRTKLETGRKSG